MLARGSHFIRGVADELAGEPGAVAALVLVDRHVGYSVLEIVGSVGAIAAVVGAKPLPRTELTKKLWAYIKKNGLQDKKNKRMINADDALKAVFGGKSQVSMFDMTKLVSKNLS